MDSVPTNTIHKAHLIEYFYQKCLLPSYGRYVLCTAWYDFDIPIDIFACTMGGSFTLKGTQIFVLVSCALVTSRIETPDIGPANVTPADCPPKKTGITCALHYLSFLCSTASHKGRVPAQDMMHPG